LVYTAPDTYPGSVVEIKYTISCNGETKSAIVYIHVIESCNGEFTTCKDVPYQMCLRTDNPTGTKYLWYDKNNVALGETAPRLNNPVNGAMFYVKPVLPATSAYAKIDFPKAEIVMKVNSCEPLQIFRLPDK
jgi:hypothetical protein